MVHRARLCSPYTSFILRYICEACSPSARRTGKLLFVLTWRNLSCNELRKQLSRIEDIDAKPLTTHVQLGIPPRNLSASTLTHRDLIQRRYS
ncbi:hypothetical protein AVEN_245530-1 [Araneus ventricosus]|uniref:Uncharacterized protein n=1 Tax=Araneus ventricosus TaxID=182803 RepID=A0A4Y2JX64_ARAVE|nr:hypothetical protein AVEN_245530-1 [Araneus ventricosus]